MIDIDASMFELFREEVRLHASTLSRGLLDTEADPGNAARIEPLMRAAHSIKGAARIIGIELGVRLSHVMEDALVAAQTGSIRLSAADVDLLLQGSDILSGLAELTPDTITAWDNAHAQAIERLEPALKAMAAGQTLPAAEIRAAARPVAGDLPVESSPHQVKFTKTPDDPFPPVPEYHAARIPPEPFALSSEHSMLDLFREELRANLLIVSAAFPGDLESALEALKQIRGAARIVKSLPIELLALAMWQFVSAAQERRTGLTPAALNWLHFAISTLAEGIGTDEESHAGWLNEASGRLSEIAAVFTRAKDALPAVQIPVPQSPREESRVSPASPAIKTELTQGTRAEGSAAAPVEAVVRVTAQSLNRLLGLAGESLVQARWLPSFSTHLLVLKKHHDLLASLLDRAFHAAAAGARAAELSVLVAHARKQASVCRNELADRTAGFEDHAARAEDLNARLYREVIVSRMRPFGDGIHGLPRLVRDMARSLGKEAKLVVEGENTEVDRDILEKLESPLSHLVRNAVDHGLESPAARARSGKPGCGTVRVEARHRAGMLHVVVADDGGGVDLERLRQKIVERGLNSAELLRQMSETELLEFLFLPGFSTASAVTEFSGRGVGLDVVQDTIRKVGGTVRISTEKNRGTTFHLQLPLTLSVIRAVVVEVCGEPYAFPHTRIDRLIRIHRKDVRSLEHRQFITVDGHNIGLVMAAQLLDLPPAAAIGEELAVVLLSDATGIFGLVVDRFRGEQDLVVRPLDPRLGKVPNLSAAAILDDGSPVLIVDVEDLLRSTDQYIQTGSLTRCDTRAAGPTRKKRVLVVDDSLTVREVERQLLLHRGYDVSIAVDGMEGWNKIRSEKFDLLVSDIDMPRMSGLQLVTAVRSDDKLRDLPVVIVSYKEREEDRLRGLEVGANCYLTKSSFHDNRFIEAVEDLIGTA